MMCTTTLNKIRAHSLRQDGWKKLLAHLGKATADDELLTLQIILESNGLDDALWCLRASDATEFEMRRFARLAALDVAHLWDMPAIVSEYLKTGDATKRYAAGVAALDAVQAAVWAVAQDVSQATAHAAAWDAARAAAWAARVSSWVAVQVSSWAAQDASQNTAREIQTERFISMFCTEDKP